ncbi:hypothetical protein WGM54_14225 [Paenibacillus polymyxa]|uniref:hypothetical protein n=1 Tax=Paenibacillus polymyxa TaxID=1406 RepID=UPI00307F5E8E
MNINEKRRKNYEDVKSRLSEMEHEEFMEIIDEVFRLIEVQDKNPKNDDFEYFFELRENIELYELLLLELSKRKNQAIANYQDYL